MVLYFSGLPIDRSESKSVFFLHRVYPEVIGKKIDNLTIQNSEHIYSGKNIIKIKPAEADKGLISCFPNLLLHVNREKKNYPIEKLAKNTISKCMKRCSTSFIIETMLAKI